jgi:hypothetical protein
MSESVAVEGSGIRPARFNGKSIFSAWKFKTLAYLQSLGLKEVVVDDPDMFPLKDEMKTPSGTTAVAASGSDGVSSSSSMKKNVVKAKCEKAYSILLNLLEDQLIDLIVNVEPGDAHHVWKILLDTFEVKSTASLCHRLDLLMSIRFDLEKETFDMFKGRFTKLILELKERGEVISPAIQRYVLLRAMPTRYESLIQSLKINDFLPIEEVFIHIKDYWEADMRRHRSGNKKETGADGDFAALVARKKCYGCGSKEHLIRHCPKHEEGSDSSSEPGTPSDSESEGTNDGKRKKTKKSKKTDKRITLG